MDSDALSDIGTDIEHVDLFLDGDEGSDSLDLYRFADEESIDWDAEADSTLAMFYESEAIRVG